MFTNVSRPSAVDVLRPFVVGDTFYADTTSTLAKRAIGSTNDIWTVSGGVPVWSSSIVVAGLTVTDSGFFIVGSADATKRLNFEVDAQTANDTLTISTGAQTDSRTLSVPVLAGADTIATLAVANAFTGNNTMAGTLELTTASNGLTISKTTGTTLTVSSTSANISRPSNAFYCAGGGGFDQGISLGPTGGVSIYQTANSAWRCTTNGSTDNLYVDFARWTWRDPSDSFNEKMTLFNGILTLPVTTGTTLTVSSTDAASVSLSGGILLDGATTKTIKYTNGTANAAVAVTFGAVGPTGSTAGNQVGWLRVNVAGTDRYIPYW